MMDRTLEDSVQFVKLLVPSNSSALVAKILV